MLPQSLSKVHYRLVLRYRRVINRIAQRLYYDPYKVGTDEKIIVGRASRSLRRLGLKNFHATLFLRNSASSCGATAASSMLMALQAKLRLCGVKRIL